MFDPFHQWLGIPPSEQPPDHYRLLEIPLFENDPEVIDAGADRQLAALHDHTNGERAAIAEEISNQVSKARRCLLNPIRKREYDERFHEQPDWEPVDAEPATTQSMQSAFADDDALEVNTARNSHLPIPPPPPTWWVERTAREGNGDMDDSLLPVANKVGTVRKLASRMYHFVFDSFIGVENEVVKDYRVWKVEHERDWADLSDVLQTTAIWLLGMLVVAMLFILIVVVR